MTLTFPLPNRLIGDNLEAELAADGIPASVTAYADHLEIRVPDGTNEAAVAAVVAAHTGTLTPEQVEQIKLGSTGLPFTTAEYTAVRAQMQNLRDLRQMGRNAFMGLSAAERDRMTYDALTSVTIVLLSILRDEG